MTIFNESIESDPIDLLFKERVIQTLRLMKEYNCVDIIHDVYASPHVYQTLSKNPRLKNYITEIKDTFEEYLELEECGEDETSSCVLV